MTVNNPFPTTNRSFDRIAWCYDFLASLVFGTTQRRAQAHFLHFIPNSARVLLIGGGSGWLLKRLLLEKPAVKVVYLEASQKMIELAQSRTAQVDTQLVEWRCGTEQSLSRSDRFDVLITPFLLDLFTEEQLIKEFLPTLLPSLVPKGIWLFTDFVYAGTWWQKALERGMYWFFRPIAHLSASQLPDFDSCFERFNFQQRAKQRYYQGFIEARILVRK